MTFFSLTALKFLQEPLVASGGSGIDLSFVRSRRDAAEFCREPSFAAREAMDGDFSESAELASGGNSALTTPRVAPDFRNCLLDLYICASTLASAVTAFARCTGRQGNGRTRRIRGDASGGF